ncbi:hypothetical protein D3C80_2024800 [compost metagenome]
MKINDTRSNKKEIDWHHLVSGEVYVSSRKQKYLIYTQEEGLICLESGEWFSQDEMSGDVFTHVNARLEIE